MGSSDITCVLKSLQTLNLDTVDEKSGCELGKLFDTCTRLKTLIDDSSLSSNADTIQEALLICIKTLEKCTLMVNDLELFSSNETAEELQTSSMKYLLLPAFLGSLHLLLKNAGLAERLHNLETADVYFKDFILRCTNYELCGTSSKDLKDMFDCDTNKKSKGPTTDPELVRQKKIELYKRKKELEDKEKLLKPALERPDSEEYIREYYLTLIERWLILAEEELENSEKEKELLSFMSKKDNTIRDTVKDSKLNVKPLQPFIITKNEIQKQVFGLGYPSIPVLTIDDYYRQKFEKQIQEQKENEIERQRQQKQGRSLQDAALSGEGLSKEDEDLQKELLLDRDDPEALAKARRWDDWKDDNPRGAGNRYNKG